MKVSTFGQSPPANWTVLVFEKTPGHNTWTSDGHTRPYSFYTSRRRRRRGVAWRMTVGRAQRSGAFEPFQVEFQQLIFIAIIPLIRLRDLNTLCDVVVGFLKRGQPP